MKTGFKRAGALSAVLVGMALSGCSSGITGMALFPETPLACAEGSSVCGLSNTKLYYFEVRGRGTCGTIGLEWGDGTSQTMRGDFAATASKTWIGVHHDFARTVGNQSVQTWPGPKQARAFSVANCTGDVRFPYQMMHSTPQPDGSMRHNAAYQLAILGKQDKPCGSRPEMANLRIGSRVIIDRLPTNTDMNFGCLFSGCINGPEGNAGPVTPAFPFPTMRRHSLVLRVVNTVAGQVQLVQGQAQHTEFVVNANGPLEFCVNDDVLGDNSGGWGLAVQVDETTAR